MTLEKNQDTDRWICGAGQTGKCVRYDFALNNMLPVMSSLQFLQPYAKAKLSPALLAAFLYS